MKNGLLKSLGLSFLIGTSALADSETNYVFYAFGSKFVRCAPEEKHKVETEARDCPPEFGWKGELVSYPEKVVGRTAEIGVDARDMEGSNRGISEVVLYQDGKKLLL
jgi:hypothetical protein